MDKVKITKDEPWISVNHLVDALAEKVSGLKVKLELMLGESKHVITHVVESLIDYEPFTEEYLELFADFVFPVLPGDYLVAGFKITPDGYFVLDELKVFDKYDLEDYYSHMGVEVTEIEEPHLFIQALIDYKSLGGRNSKKVEEIHDFLKSIGFEVPKSSYYPYYDYPLEEKEYDWYYEWR
jgi:hypothetical protein